MSGLQKIGSEIGAGTRGASLGIEAIKNHLPIQPGDVPITYADVSDLTTAVGFKPDTQIEVGVQRFCRLVSDLLPSLIATWNSTIG